MRQAEPLHDGHGRPIGDLRVSVTDRCNFRCQYCMPAEGLPWLDRSEILTFEEIDRLVRLFVSMGVADVRLTGGEPLVRRDFPLLVEMLGGIDGLHDLSLTTNGYLLEGVAGDLAAAGLRRINVSLDSLSLTKIGADITVDPVQGCVTVVAEARTTDRTGVEMEALVACSVAALTVYDMVKGIEPGVVIERVELLDKTGGKADFHRA